MSEPAPNPTATGKTKRFLTRVWGWLRIAAGWFPLTARSVLAVPLLVWVLAAYGLGRKDQILVAVGVGGLALVALATLGVLGVALWLRLRRQPAPHDPLVFDTETPLPTGFTLGRLNRVPLFKFDLSWEQPQGVRVRLGDGPDGLLFEEVTADERASAGAVVRKLMVTDVFGLARFSVRWRTAQPITIRPRAGRVRPFDILRQHVTGDELAHPDGRPRGDLLEMRPYAPGDPLKLVLWKIYARTGRMLVRAPERSFSLSDRTLAYLVASAADEPAAGITRAVLESGCLGGDFLFAADGAEQPTRDVAVALDQVVRSINFRGEGGNGLASFLAQGESQGISACILFVPHRPGEWLGRVEQQLSRSRGPFRAIIGVDGFQPPPTRRWLHRLLFCPALTAGSDPAAVREVYERLQQAGAEVSVLDRLSGQMTVVADLPTEPRPTSPALL